MSTESELWSKVEGFICPDCSRVYEEGEEPPPLRECSNDNCAEQFASEDRACPSCNRTFTRRLAEHGCEDCNVEVEEGERFKCAECDEMFESDEEAEDHYAKEHHAELLSLYRAAMAKLATPAKEAAPPA